MDELFRDMLNKGLVSEQKSGNFGQALQHLNAEAKLNRQISLELAQTVPFEATTENNDYFNPTDFEVGQLPNLRDKLIDRRN